MQSRVKHRMVTMTAVNQHLSDVLTCSILQFLHHSFITHILGCTLMKPVCVSRLLAHMTSSSSDVILRLPQYNVLRERGGNQPPDGSKGRLSCLRADGCASLVINRSLLRPSAAHCRPQRVRRRTGSVGRILFSYSYLFISYKSLKSSQK